MELRDLIIDIQEALGEDWITDPAHLILWNEHVGKNAGIVFAPFAGKVRISGYFPPQTYGRRKSILVSQNRTAKSIAADILRRLWPAYKESYIETEQFRKVPFAVIARDLSDTGKVNVQFTENGLFVTTKGQMRLSANVSERGVEISGSISIEDLFTLSRCIE